MTTDLREAYPERWLIATHLAALVEKTAVEPVALALTKSSQAKQLMEGQTYYLPNYAAQQAEHEAAWRITGKLTNDTIDLLWKLHQIDKAQANMVSDILREYTHDERGMLRYATAFPLSEGLEAEIRTKPTQARRAVLAVFFPEIDVQHTLDLIAREAKRDSLAKELFTDARRKGLSQTIEELKTYGIHYRRNPKLQPEMARVVADIEITKSDLYFAMTEAERDAARDAYNEAGPPYASAGTHVVQLTRDQIAEIVGRSGPNATVYFEGDSNQSES